MSQIVRSNELSFLCSHKLWYGFSVSLMTCIVALISLCSWQCIAPELIILRVALGQAWSYQTAFHAISNIPTANVGIGMDIRTIDSRDSFTRDDGQLDLGIKAVVDEERSKSNDAEVAIEAVNGSL